MCDNLKFYNLKENKEVIHNLIESHFGIEDAKMMKIDRSHRIEKQRGTKPQAIVAKFNYFPDSVNSGKHKKTKRQGRIQTQN
jgi:hypothetical protein